MSNWLDWAAKRRLWDFVADIHDLYLSVFSSALFWQNPTQPQRNCEAWTQTASSLPRSCSCIWRGKTLLEGIERWCGCSAAHVPCSVHSMCHEAFTDTHTPLPSGWLARDRLAHYLYRQEYFSSLHYSKDGPHADKVHVFRLPGVTSVSPFLCTALRWCKANSE